jgi:hypothetical protein
LEPALASLRTHLNILLALSVLTIIAAGSFHLARGLGAKADTFYIYYTGYKWWQRDAATTAIRKIQPLDREERYEVMRRERAAFNYPLAGAANAISGRFMRKIWPEAYTGKGEYPKALIWAIGLAHGLGFLAGVGVIALVFLRCREFIPPLALTVAFMALVGFLPGPIPSDQLLLYSGHEFLFNILALIVSPGESFSALSFWPKCSVGLLLLGVLALRWKGAIPAAYGLTAVMAVFHVGLAISLFVIFAGIDLIYRPGKLLNRPTILAAGALVAVIAFNGTLWFVAETATAAQISLIGLPILLAFYLARRYFAPLQENYPIHFTDSITLLCALVIALPIVIFGYLAATPETPWGPHSIWVQMLSRIIVCTVTVVLFALAVSAWHWLKGKLGEIDGLRCIIVALSLVSLMSIYGATGAWWIEGRKIIPSIFALDGTGTKQGLTQLYFNVVSSLDMPGPSARPLGN